MLLRSQIRQFKEVFKMVTCEVEAVDKFIQDIASTDELENEPKQGGD